MGENNSINYTYNNIWPGYDDQYTTPYYPQTWWWPGQCPEKCQCCMCKLRREISKLMEKLEK